MPLYAVRCKKCKKEFEAGSGIAKRGEIRCDCGGGVIRLIVPMQNTFEPFKPYLLEHGVSEPVMINSRAERDRVFRENKIDQKTFKNRKYNPYSRLFPVTGKSSKGSGTTWSGERGLTY